MEPPGGQRERSETRGALVAVSWSLSTRIQPEMKFGTKGSAMDSTDVRGCGPCAESQSRSRGQSRGADLSRPDLREVEPLPKLAAILPTLQQMVSMQPNVERKSSERMLGVELL